MRNRRRSEKRCGHAEAVVTVTAGIERTVCMGCGEVKIQFDHSACTVWPERLGSSVCAAEDGLVVTARR